MLFTGFSVAQTTGKQVGRGEYLEVSNAATDSVLVLHLRVLKLVKYAVLGCRGDCLNVPNTFHFTCIKNTRLLASFVAHGLSDENLVNNLRLKQIHPVT